MKVAFERGRLSRRLTYLVIAVAVDRFGFERIEQHGTVSFDLHLVNESDYALIILHDLGTDGSAGQCTTIAGLDANRTLGIAEDAHWDRSSNERFASIQMACHQLTRSDLRRACENERALRADPRGSQSSEPADTPPPPEPEPASTNATPLARQLSTVK
jgi:hypothetical protein